MRHIDYYKQLILGGGNSESGGGGGGITPTGTLELDYGELDFGQSVDETQDVTDKAEVHVAVSAKEPSGTLDIYDNGTKDVTEYASVNVQVPQPTGTKEINITQNGDVTEDVKDVATANIHVNVPTTEPSGTAELDYTLEKGVYTLDETADVSGKANAHVTVDASALEPSGSKLWMVQNMEFGETYPYDIDVKDVANLHLEVTAPEPWGTKEVMVNQNGDITEDVKDYASVKITTNVAGGDAELERKYEELLKAITNESANSYSIVNSDIRSLGDYALYNRERLTEAQLPNVTTLGDRCFYNCYMLSNLVLGDISRVPSYCFYNCRRLEQFNSRTAKSIESYAFMDSVGDYAPASNHMILKTVKCESASSIRRNAFAGLKYIETIDILGGGEIERMADTNKALESLVNFIMRDEETVTTVAYTAFAATTNIYVPDALVESYKTATNWSTYAEQIHPLSEYVEPEV